MKITFKGKFEQFSNEQVDASFEIQPSEIVETAELFEIPIKDMMQGLFGVKKQIENASK